MLFFYMIRAFADNIPEQYQVSRLLQAFHQNAWNARSGLERICVDSQLLMNFKIDL
jgi:hypothetical protein